MAESSSGAAAGILEDVLRRSHQLVSKGGLDAVFSKNKSVNVSAVDQSIYGMAAEGKSSAEILKFIASASRNPFYRQVAKLLTKTGIAPSITVGDSDGWKFNAGNDKTYAAAYNPKTDIHFKKTPAIEPRQTSWLRWRKRLTLT